MQSGQAGITVMFEHAGTCLLAGYILFYFNVGAFSVPLLRRRYVNLISLNRTSRSEWVHLLSRDPKEGINAGEGLRLTWMPISPAAAEGPQPHACCTASFTDPFPFFLLNPSANDSQPSHQRQRSGGSHCAAGFHAHQRRCLDQGAVH